MRIALTGGFYKARSVISSAQRCLNLFPEVNPSDAPSPTTHYLTPGLDRLASATGAGSRCSYTASTGALFEVIGTKVYHTNANFTRSEIGNIALNTTPVSISDNGVIAVLVDGTAQGYFIDLTSYAFSAIADAAFYGATVVNYLDLFFIFNRPGTNQLYLSPPLWDGVSPLDPLDIASKSGAPDTIATIAVMHREVWLIGSQRSAEIWYNSGAVDFPFERMPGVFIDHGCAAPYSAATQDITVFWLMRDLQGQAIVVQGSNYEAKRVSTHAIENEFLTYSTISDAIGFTYQEEGHIFYVLTFPSADKTWVYDVATGLWHERAWIDSDGIEHRIRPNNAALAYGKNVCGDWEDGRLYHYDLNTYTDDGDPITRRRGFPHMMNDGKRVFFRNFIADMQPGSALAGQVVVILPPVASGVSQDIAQDSTASDIALDLSGGLATSVAVSTQASHGTATAVGTTITYTPTAGYSGPDSFEYTASNTAGTSAPATVSITVVPHTVVFITSGSTFSVPSDFVSLASIEAIGAGGRGGDGRGGGGGAYAKITSLSLAASQLVNIQIGAGSSETDTWFNSSGTLLAAAGENGGGFSNASLGVGGLAADSVGTTKYSGGNGGIWSASTGGTGGGGAAGPSGAGKNGGTFTGITYCGSGGGGANGGTNGATATENTPAAGSAGGNNNLGAGGGAGGAVNSPGANGSNGGGGGGGGTTPSGTGGGNGGNGSQQNVWTQTSNSALAGPGGGGGGSAYQSTGVSGAGGGYGGAGAGARFPATVGGAGTGGLIVFTYSSVAPPTPIVNPISTGDGDPQVSLRWSDTRGASWGNPISQGFGGAGEYIRSVQFNQLGMARDRVFELFWSAAAPCALNGAFVDVQAAAT